MSVDPTVDRPQFQGFLPDESNVRRDITLLSYLLAKVHCDKNFIGASNVNLLEAWIYLASILTTGDAQDPSGNNNVVAVTGQVENDAIAAVLGTPNVSCRLSHKSQTSQLSVSELQSMKTGLALLRNYDSTPMDVTFSEHAADVFAVLQHLFAPVNPDLDRKPEVVTSTRTVTFATFISRRCYRKLRARVNLGTKLWTKHPLKLIHSWYHGDKPAILESKQFRLPSSLRPSLDKYNLHPDKDDVLEGELTYTVSQDTAVSWISAEWTVALTNALYEAVVILHHINAREIIEHLITPGLADDLAEKHRRGAQSGPAALGGAGGDHTTAAAKTSNCPSADAESEAAQPSSQRSSENAPVNDVASNVATSMDNPSAAMGVENEDDKGKVQGHGDEKGDDQGDEKDDNWDDQADGKMRIVQLAVQALEDTPPTGDASRASVVRYLRTLCTPYTAAQFYVLYGRRMARHGVRLKAYTLSSNLKPSVPRIDDATVREFAHKFLKHFPFPEDYSDVLTSAFEKLAKPLENYTLDAAEHAEATLMALACSSRSDARTVNAMGPGLETESTKTVQDMFKSALSAWVSRVVPVGVSKKCCFCCYKLATLLKERAGLDFVLQGMRSVIFLWVPPDGVPTEVLIDLRLTLVRVLYDTIAEAVNTLRSVQTSSADSVSASDPPSSFPPQLHLPPQLRARVAPV
ncbi:hypothetical protein C8T65DRAFT_696412 [Cerioporus squamosus]|nr:hypothetical protein C8T65DRAFT_696412 [Cerioporus squamosus]